MPMSDGSGARAEDWGGYLRRMTNRPGWSVAKLARESGVHRGTIFKWIRGGSGVTINSVRAIAEALGDDLDNALRAAGSVADELPQDEEIELVRTDERLPPEVKKRIIDHIIDRRERERAASLEETRRMIELLRGTA